MYSLKSTSNFKAGNGGDGSIHLASVFAQEFAGPDGGSGGNGGHVIFRASKMVSSLVHIKLVLKDSLLVPLN